MHRHDTPCHWCGEVKSTWRLSGPALRSAAAIALTVTAAAGAWRYGPALRDVTSSLASSAASVGERARALSEQERPAAASRVASSTAAMPSTSGVTGTMPGTALQDSATSIVMDTAPDMPTSADSIVWTPAVARTWVNVRSDASRGGEVVGVIKPASRAMLGTDRGGWRQVRLSDVTGWVDPKLFEPDSLRTRGE
ncbi:SH3 domain-containing protein [Gemmatimonas aurantiaca]|uniref:SH3 domain-containing protein n=1 Tax=Gemmatimonas aurantiaca TaxID=173480 RepID=UPI00301CCF3D